MLLVTDDKGNRAIQCDLIEEARTFDRCRYITIDGDFHAITEITEQEEGYYLVRLQQVERPAGIGSDRDLFITGDADLSDQA